MRAVPNDLNVVGAVCSDPSCGELVVFSPQIHTRMLLRL